MDNMGYQRNILDTQFPWLSEKYHDKLQRLKENMDNGMTFELEDICSEVCEVQADPADSEPLLDDYLIAFVNRNNLGWTATRHPRFENMTTGEFKKTLGAIVEQDVRVSLPRRRVEVPKDLPADFDARTQWKDCPLIGHARDQSNCGSCWAFGSTEAFNDRMCIKTGLKASLSAADTVGCCDFLKCFSMGCDGGQIGTPYNFFQEDGVPTGGDYGSKDADNCYDYTMPMCAHHVVSPTLKDCSTVKQVAPTCPKTCPDGTASGADKKYKGSGSYSLGSMEELMADIVQNGPVTVAFTVYKDFLSYKDGVYKHVSGEALGGHAVKVIGYGTLKGEDYWLVMNSWNETWGMDGAFMIARGGDADPGFVDQNAAGEVAKSY